MRLGVMIAIGLPDDPKLLAQILGDYAIGEGLKKMALITACKKSSRAHAEADRTYQITS
jgi:hypothetical protein